MPLYHCFGMVMGVLGCATHGAAMVFPAEAFEPQSVLEAVSAEQCTALYGVPTMFIAELEHPSSASYDLRVVAHWRDGRRALPGRSDEARHSRHAHARSHDLLRHDGNQPGQLPEPQRRSASNGASRPSATIHPHLEVKIVDADGRVVPRGERGELLTRGYSVMHGYWDEPQKTREAVDEQGWMHTGDLATLDEAGYCNIVGRVKDLIIRGGENISPREIEEFLFRHPKIQDVQVFGIPDRRFGEIVCAWIRLKPGQQCTAEEIRDFCREQIAHYKVPAHVRFVDEFPMTVTGQDPEVRDARGR